MNKKIITLILVFFSFLCILSGCKINKEPDKTELQIKQEEIYTCKYSVTFFILNFGNLKSGILKSFKMPKIF